VRKLLLILGIAFINNIQAADLAIPIPFTPGTPAVAAEVNANFTAVESAVNDNNTNITTNTTSIGGNATSIGANATSIGGNTTSIGSNTTAIGGNTSSIGSNTTAIGGNTTSIGGNTTSIGDNTTSIGSNTTAIGDNTTSIGDNTTGIVNNTANITINTPNIANNTSDIANIDSRVSMLEVTYLIGDIGPAGGWVFYVTGDGLHGLEAAPVDQASSTWGCISTDIVGAESTAIGTGARNTDDIIRRCATAGIAAVVADEYISPSGYIDWYLPSTDELNEMYLNIGPGSAAPVNVGGFTSIFGAAYWSSSEFGINGALGQRFDTAVQAGTLKSFTVGVRAVRAF